MGAANVQSALEVDDVLNRPVENASYKARETAALVALLDIGDLDIAEGRTVDIRIAVERIKRNHRPR